VSILSVAEYGRIFKSDEDLSLDDGNLRLTARHFNSLLTVLDNEEEDAPDYSRVMTYLRPKGQEQLRVQNFVGVVRLDDGAQIEVLPKLSKHLNRASARKLLVKMLVELIDSPFFEGTAADLEAHDMPIFELVLRCYLEQVTTIVRKGIARTYVTQQDNLVFLRGKLQLTEHIRRNSYNATRAYCEFDEYEADRPINRLIKGALLIVSKLSRDATNQQRCRELLFWFDGVPATVDPRTDLQRMRRDRLVQHYAPAMPLCKLILFGLNPLTQQGENQVISILFPMETVFESYVAAKLPSQLGGWKVSTQATGKALVDDHLNRRMFNLKPDLKFSKAHCRVIGDTKWKLINQANRSEKYGISQSDIYQLYGYTKKYLNQQQKKEVLLIYPASEKFTEPLAPFWYRERDEVLYVVPFDLEMERLILPSQSLLNEELQIVAQSV
jgi:5-methylcytosine-specific restriction enzyme subunit McrC